MKPPLVCPIHFDPIKLSHYPLIDDIPWLFVDPVSTLKEWREQGHMLVQFLSQEIVELKQLAETSNSVHTKTRLSRVCSLKSTHLEMLRNVLAPILKDPELNFVQHQAYGYRLPVRQRLLGYFPNLIRDWSERFENENKSLFESVLSTLNNVSLSQKTILVLGAGGSRLAYDLAHFAPDSLVIALDLNPVLLLSAKKIAHGQKLVGVEATFAAKNPSDPGHEVTLKAPHGPLKNLHFVFGDVYNLPLSPASIDICVSPWLVDILPRRFEDLCRSIAAVTKPSGLWCNAGSLNFDFRNESENFGIAEIEEIGSLNGWQPKPATQVEVPYLQSAFDAHRRFETLTLFQWCRDNTKPASKPVIDDRPQWLQRNDMPIPILSMFEAGAAIHATMALVLSLVDGERTLADIAKVVSQENELSFNDASDAVTHFFDRFLRERRFRESV